MSEESDIQGAILDYLKLRGFFAWPSPNRAVYDSTRKSFRRPPRHFVPGVPDVTVAMPNGRTLYIEVKTDKGRVSDHQRAFHARLVGLGHSLLIARSVKDVHEVLHDVRASAYKPISV